MTIKAKLKKSLHWLFVSAQRLGVDILPRHFYSQIPDIAKLRGTNRWRSAMSMHGVLGAALESQEAVFANWMERASHADTRAQSLTYLSACGENGASGYGPTEAEVWFRMFHAIKPKQMIQIGAGVSTAIALDAMANRYAANDRRLMTCEITAIDPFPTDYLKRLARDKRINLHIEPAQESSMALFERLDAGDVLFIDSTHTVSPGSEVNYLILEVLPRLKPGVLVHFHDIYFPYDYQRKLLHGELFFQSESTLLHAFLLNNKRFSIEFALSALHYGKPESIKKYVASYRPEGNNDGLANTPEGHFPSAISLRVNSDV